VEAHYRIGFVGARCLARYFNNPSASCSGFRRRFRNFVQFHQACRHRSNLRLCMLVLCRIGRQFTRVDALLLNAELVQGNDAVVLINK